MEWIVDTRSAPEPTGRWREAEFLTEIECESGVPLVSIVIVNYNGLAFVEQCIRSVLASDYSNLEIIVVDNASTDGSYELLRSLCDGVRVKIVRNERNSGFSGGNNVGYEHSVGAIVVFLNVDTRVEPSWLRELTKAMNADSAIGAAQCKLLAMNDPTRIDSAGGYMDPLGYVYLKGHWYVARPQEDRTSPFYAEGAAMAVRRTAICRVLLDRAPFDSDYFCYYEDSDLSWRMRLGGFKVVLASQSIVYHHRGYATGKLSHMKIFNSGKNRISTLVKNYGFPSLLRWLPLLIILELLRAIMFLKEQPRSAYAKLSAVFWCLRNLGPLWRKRVLVQSRLRKVPDSEIIGAMIRPNFGVLFRSVKVPSKSLE